MFKFLDMMMMFTAPKSVLIRKCLLLNTESEYFHFLVCFNQTK